MFFLFFSRWIFPILADFHFPCLKTRFFRYRYLPGIRYSRYPYFRSVLLYVSFGGNTFLRFRGNSFFEKFCRNSFFSSKGAKCTKRGLAPPLLRKKGAPVNFLRGSRQSFDTENTHRVFLRYWYGKYQEILTDTNRKIPIWDTTLLKTA
jgi:hypothetical protein